MVRDKFGDKAGWAHSVLFAAELPQFRILLPTDMQYDMKIYSEQRKLLNKEKKILSQSASSLSSPKQTKSANKTIGDRKYLI